MIHTCEEGDSHYESHKRRKVVEEPCGLTYNDVNNSTVCPHNSVGRPLFVRGDK